MVSVYTLHEPDTGELRYIGITRVEIELRLQRHLEKQKDFTHRSNWIQKLKSQHKRPVAKELHVVDNIDTACVLERFYIASGRYFEFDLVNSTGGGDGIYSPVEETRRKMSEAAKKKFKDVEYRKHNVVVQSIAQNKPETIAKKRAAALRPEMLDKVRAVMQTEEWKTAHRAGIAANKEKHRAAVKLAGSKPEFKAKISALAKARWDNPEYRARVTAAIRASNPGRPKRKV